MAKDKKKAFTIVELVVAMGLLVMLVSLSRAVFTTTVKAHRKAAATIEITRNLRVLTGQLNADFGGLRKDAPLMFWFDSTVTAGGDEERFDTTHFFADGDFQTARQYYDGTNNKTIYGNIARIFYGHANSPAAVPDFKTCQVLSRKSHILTADSDILTVHGEIPLISNAVVIDYGLFDNGVNAFGVAMGSTYPLENELEFNTITLTNWINALNYLEAPPPLPSPPATAYNADWFITHCLTDAYRPVINLTDFQTLHLLMAKGVMEFSIQWAYTPDDLTAPVAGFTEGVRWWPSVDPDGDPATNDSDFAGMNGGNPFGVYFTLPNGTTNLNWFSIESCQTNGVMFSNTFYPKALKFTFRLKDSNNIFPAGKTFTHIVYLDN